MNSRLRARRRSSSRNSWKSTFAPPDPSAMARSNSGAPQTSGAREGPARGLEVSGPGRRRRVKTEEIPHGTRTGSRRRHRFRGPEGASEGWEPGQFPPRDRARGLEPPGSARRRDTPLRSIQRSTASADIIHRDPGRQRPPGHVRDLEALVQAPGRVPVAGPVKQDRQRQPRRFQNPVPPREPGGAVVRHVERRPRGEKAAARRHRAGDQGRATVSGQNAAAAEAAAAHSLVGGHESGFLDIMATCEVALARRPAGVILFHRTPVLGLVRRRGEGADPLAFTI